MTSLPISSKTNTFHIAPPEAGSCTSAASFWASTSVMGALRFRIRFMLAGEHAVSPCAQYRVQRHTYLLVPQ